MKYLCQYGSEDNNQNNTINYKISNIINKFTTATDARDCRNGGQHITVLSLKKQNQPNKSIKLFFF